MVISFKCIDVESSFLRVSQELAVVHCGCWMAHCCPEEQNCHISMEWAVGLNRHCHWNVWWTDDGLWWCKYDWTGWE